ncbi:hypothetical protein [Sorangium sp. So ce124]|uniref:hypothetical protein n=1 Tax=Sorangium sp. So ce124 TaxID=3133280 RepID=UPI003F5F4D31
MADDARTSAFAERHATLATSSLPRGTLAGDYVLGALLARAGCGSVYWACQRHTECPAAVKVLHERLAAMPNIVQRFTREVHVVHLLGHPNIVDKG